MTGATAAAGEDKPVPGKDAEAGLSDDGSVELPDEGALLIESGATSTLAGWADCAGSAIDAMGLSAVVSVRTLSAGTASWVGTRDCSLTRGFFLRRTDVTVFAPDFDKRWEEVATGSAVHKTQIGCTEQGQFRKNRSQCSITHAKPFGQGGCILLQ